MTLLISVFGAANIAFAAETISLRPYYVYYQIPGRAPYSGDMAVIGFPPEVRVIGGGADPANITTPAGVFAPVDRLLAAGGLYEFPGSPLFADSSFSIGDDPPGLCGREAVRFPMRLLVGHQVAATRRYDRLPPTFPGEKPVTCGDLSTFSATIPAWQVQDRITLLAPVRRKATDGSEYEASPMLIEREGLPWMTYYAGYRLGFVASESNWLASNVGKSPALANWPAYPDARDNFELAKLPRPFVEGEVVEYVNQLDFPKSLGGIFFYAASLADQAALDASANWWRTGQSFKSGGYVPVCRLYGSATLGPNTHFYTADAAECKTLQSNPALHFEGTPFRASRLIPATSAGVATCPTATIPLYRGFNNPAGNGYDPNHRYVTKRELLTKMTTVVGWVEEGAVMCVPE